MCLWILTACLGLLPGLPGNTTPVNTVTGFPAPIIIPTAASTASANPIQLLTLRNITVIPTKQPQTTLSTTTPTQSSLSTLSRVPTQKSTTPAMVTGSVTNVTTSPLMTIYSPTTKRAVMSTTSPPPSMTTMSSKPDINQPHSPLLICPNPETVCTVSPYESAARPLPIDPRVGLTPPSSEPISKPFITGYNVRIPARNKEFKFPKTSRNSLRKNKMYSKAEKYNFKKTGHHIIKRQSCSCVTSGTCIRNLIDVRIVTPPVSQCPTGQEYCCGNSTGTVTPVSCGVLQEVPPTVITPGPGEAGFGEVPWQAAVLTTNNPADYVCSAVLIDSLNVLTVAHGLSPYVVPGAPLNIIVRLGEWDPTGTDPLPYQEYVVSKVFYHPMYNPNTLQNDIALLRLATAVPFTPSAGSVASINRVCLPPENSVYTGQRCRVTGWGLDRYGPNGQYPVLLKKVDVPVVSSDTCQSQLQAARLGSTFWLDSASFICAGGEMDKDACTGDGGSGLICQVNGQWVLIGLVAWGLGCGSSNVPGVYTNVVNFMPWIQQQIATP